MSLKEKLKLFIGIIKGEIDLQPKIVEIDKEVIKTVEVTKPVSLLEFVPERKKYLEELAENDLDEEQLLVADIEYQQLEYIERFIKRWLKTRQ